MKFSNELKKKIEIKNVEKMIEQLLDLTTFNTFILNFVLNDYIL